ncbi:hypothetical protein ACHQM5_018746 [Ranunculus cassubicifolius]
MAEQKQTPNSSIESSKLPANLGEKVQNLGRNPPDAANPDATTLRDQWRFAIRQYSKWYSSAWGIAIFAGMSFFALGWIIKGGNPLPSRHHEDHQQESTAKDEPKG